MTSRRPDAIIVGAGIVGAACAVALARDGKRVLVLDAAAAALGTTAAGMGHLVVMDDSPEQLALTRYSTSLWARQDEPLRVASELEWCGTVWVAEDGAQLEGVRAKQQLYAEHGIATEVLDEQSLVDAEPQLRRGLAGGLLVASDGVIYPPSAALALLARARELGAEVRERTAVLLGMELRRPHRPRPVQHGSRSRSSIRTTARSRKASSPARAPIKTSP